MLLLINASAPLYFVLSPLHCYRLHGGPWQLLLVDQSRIARLAPPAVLIRIVVGVAPRAIRIRGPFGTPIRGFVFPLVFFQAKAPPLAFPFFLCPPGKCPPPGPPLEEKRPVQSSQAGLLPPQAHAHGRSARPGLPLDSGQAAGVEGALGKSSP